MDAYTVLIAVVAACAGALTATLWCRRRFTAERRAERVRRQESLETVAAGLAHELRNPLGALSLNLQLLEEELRDARQLSDASRARLETIARDYRRFEDVLNNFLRYASRRQLVFAETDLAAVVGDLVTFIRPEVMRAQLALDVALPDAPLPCRMDAPLVKQALLNVVLNALEAVGSPGRIEVSAAAVDGFVTVTVSDTGRGISPEDMPRIFDAYFSRKKDGTGLGLAITRRIVEDHGGTIDVKSAPGRGTTVTLRFPVAGPAAPAAAKPAR